jgi:hypothetical protein
MYRDAVATNGDVRQDQDELIKPPAAEPDDKSDDLTRAFTASPTYQPIRLTG